MTTIEILLTIGIGLLLLMVAALCLGCAVLLYFSFKDNDKMQ